MNTVCSLLDHLREVAREHQGRLADTIDIESHLTRRQDYAVVLARLLGFFGPLEERLARFNELRDFGYSLEDHCKAPALLADLAALGWTSHDVRTVPRCEDLPPLHTTGEALGCVYAIARATAMLTHIHAQDLLVGFVSNYRDVSRERWPDFLDTLRAYERTKENTDDVVHSANTTFVALESWLMS